MNKQSRPGSRRSTKQGRPQRRPRTSAARPTAAEVSLVPPEEKPQPQAEPEARQRHSTPRPPETTRGTSRPSNQRRNRRKKSAPKQQPQLQQQTPDTFTTRLKRFFPVVAIPLGSVVGLIVACALIGVLASSLAPATLPSIIATSWLVFTLGPLAGSGVNFGLIPLLPALIVAAVLIRQIRKAVAHKISLADLGVLALVVLGLPTLLSVIAWLMLYDASAVYAVGPPNFFAVVGTTLGVYLLIFILGLGTTLWKILAQLLQIPTWVISVIALGLRTLGAYFLASAAIVLLALVVQSGEVGEVLSHYTGRGTAAVVVLSLLYLPNAGVFAGGLLGGSELLIGQARISLFDVVMVPLPPLPLFAALPASVSPWHQLLLALPVALFVWIGFKHLKSYGEVLVFAATIALGMGLSNWLASGSLGLYGYSSLHGWMTPLLMLFWAGVGSAVGVMLNTLLHARKNQDVVGEGTAAVVEDEPADSELVVPAAAEDTDAEVTEAADVADTDAAVIDADAEDTTDPTVEDAEADLVDAEQTTDATELSDADAGKDSGLPLADVSEYDAAEDDVLDSEKPAADELADEAPAESTKPDVSGDIFSTLLAEHRLDLDSLPDTASSQQAGSPQQAGNQEPADAQDAVGAVDTASASEEAEAESAADEDENPKN